MMPVRTLRKEICPYCGKEQRIIHLMRNTSTGVDVPVCFPCSRNGFSWLLNHFPKDRHSYDEESVIRVEG